MTSAEAILPREGDHSGSVGTASSTSCRRVAGAAGVTLAQQGASSHGGAAQGGQEAPSAAGGFPRAAALTPVMEQRQRWTQDSLDADASGDPPGLRRFNLAMGAAVLLNTLVIAIQTDTGYDEAGGLADKIGWILVDAVFLAVFLGEVGLRMRWEGLAQWARSAWSWLDVVTAAIAAVDMWVLLLMSGGRDRLNYLGVFRVLRLARLVRLVKLVRLLHGLYVIVMAFWHTAQMMASLLVLMSFGIMVFAVVAVQIIGRNDALKHVRIGVDPELVPDRFGRVYLAMYSLVELITLEGWDKVARPMVEAQPGLLLFFLTFIMVFTFGALNLVVALVIDKTLHHTRLLEEEQAKEHQRRVAEEFEQAQRIFAMRDDTGKGRLSLRAFEACLSESERIQRILEKMGVMPKEARELYAVLDLDGSGDVAIRELIEGLVKLQGGTCSTWDSMATRSNSRSTRRTLAALEAAVRGLALEQGRLAATLDDQQLWLAEIELDMARRTAMLQSIAAATAPDRVAVAAAPKKLPALRGVAEVAAPAVCEGPRSSLASSSQTEDPTG